MDKIFYELYENGREVVTDRMTILFHFMWDEERVPKKCRNECEVALLHKGVY